MLSVSFEDPGAQGASGSWSSTEPHQIFPGSAQVSLSRHHRSYFFFFFLPCCHLCMSVCKIRTRKKKGWTFSWPKKHMDFISTSGFQWRILQNSWGSLISIFLLQAIITVVNHLPILIIPRVVGMELLIQLQHVMFWLVWTRMFGLKYHHDSAFVLFLISASFSTGWKLRRISLLLSRSWLLLFTR